MRRRPVHPSLPILLAAALALGACQVVAAPSEPKRSAKPGAPGDPSQAPVAAPTSAAPTPVARASAGPAPGASQAPVPPVASGAAIATPPAGTAPRVLLKPATPTTTLRGTVAIDASYLVRAGAGAVLGLGGTRLAVPGLGLRLSDGPSPLLSNNAGNVIANNGGNIISDKGSGLVSDNGAALVSDNGAALLSDKGSGLVSDNGAALVANNGGAVMANNGATFQLLQAPAQVVPAYGAQLPAVGMNLRVVSLVDGQPVSLGVDAAVQAVTDVYTNLQGGWEVYVPAGLSGTLRVVAQAPDSADARLRYALFAHPDTAAIAATIDEDSAAMGRYVRTGLTTRFKAVLRVAREARTTGGVADADLVPLFYPDASDFVPAPLVAFLGTRLGEVIQAVAANPKIGPEDEAAVAQMLADQVYGRGPDLATVEVQPSDYTETERPLADADPARSYGKALGVMTDVLRDVRLAVVAKAAGQAPEAVEAAFAAKPYLQLANSRRPAGAAPYRIRRATDLADFMAEEYVPLVRGQAYGDNASVSNNDIQRLSKDVLTDLGVTTFRVDQLYAAAGAITLALIPAATSDEALAGMKARIQAWDR